MKSEAVIACITPKNSWVIGALSFEEYVLSVDKNLEDLVGPGFDMPNVNFAPHYDENRDPRKVALEILEEM